MHVFYVSGYDARLKSTSVLAPVNTSSAFSSSFLFPEVVHESRSHRLEWCCFSGEVYTESRRRFADVYMNVKSTVGDYRLGTIVGVCSPGFSHSSKTDFCPFMEFYAILLYFKMKITFLYKIFHCKYYENCSEKCLRWLNIQKIFTSLLEMGRSDLLQNANRPESSRFLDADTRLFFIPYSAI